MNYEGITLEGEAVRLTVENGWIAHRESIPFSPELPRLFPCLVDLQHNGALGHAYNNLQPSSEDELDVIAGHLLRHGVGRVQATFTTAEYSILENAARSLKGLLDGNARLNTLFCGIFHEGVFISPEYGWRGGHKPEFIIRPDWERFRLLNEFSGGRVRMVNIAPEVEGALDFISNAAQAGIRVSLGHCNPDSATIHRAAECGASMITHFGNGSAPQIHRFKNPFWGFLDDERLNPGLVGDGFHLPPEVVRTALRCKGKEHCFMVSDANIYSGCKPGLYHRNGGQDCVVEPNGFFHVKGEEILAGAWFQQNRCVDFLCGRCGLELEEAWRLCSVTPARLAGISLPMLKENEEATFVVWANGGIEKTVFCGENYKYDSTETKELN